MDDFQRDYTVNLVDAATRNFSRTHPCEPFDQPSEIVQLLGVDRIITECFEPAPYMSDVYRAGVAHGIVKKGALTIVVVLSHREAGLIPLGVVPLASEIGARGAE